MTTRTGPRKIPRLAVLILLGLSILLGAAAPASAAPAQGPTAVQVHQAKDADGRECEQGSVDVKGTSGLCADRYRSLSLDRGDALTANKMADAWVYDGVWGLYYSGFMGNVDLINWLYSFEWVSWISDMVSPVAANLADIINKFGIVPFAMALSAFVYGISWLRGNRSKALAGLALVCVVASMTTFFATPDKYFFGDNGVFPQAKSLGNELVTAAVSSDADTSGMYQPDTSRPANEVLLKTTVGPKMVDSLLDDPYMVISFGKKLEGDCRATFVKAMQDPEAIKSGNNHVRDKVSACDSEAKAFIESPSTRLGSVAGVAVMGLGYEVMLYGLVGILLICVLVASIKLILAVYQCVKALFPWTDTTEVFSSLVTASLYLVFVAISGLFLAITLVVSGNFMGMFSSMPAMKYQVVGALFIVGLVLLIIMWRKMVRGAQRMGDGLRNALNKANTSSNETPKVVTRGANALKSMGSRVFSSTVGNRLGNSERAETAPQSRAPGAPVAAPASGTPAQTAGSNPEPNTKSSNFKTALFAAAKKYPAVAAVAVTASRVQQARHGASTAATTGKQKARAAASAAAAQWEQHADPEKRRSAKNEALRTKLEHHDEAQAAKEQAKAQADQAQAAKVQKRQDRQRQRELRNNVATERANAPYLDPAREEARQEAAHRIEKLSGRERRVETLRARLEEGRWQEDRLRKARERAEAAQGPAGAGQGSGEAEEVPAPEPVRRS